MEGRHGAPHLPCRQRHVAPQRPSATATAAHLLTPLNDADHCWTRISADSGMLAPLLPLSHRKAHLMPRPRYADEFYLLAAGARQSAEAP